MRSIISVEPLYASAAMCALQEADFECKRIDKMHILIYADYHDDAVVTEIENCLNDAEVDFEWE